MGVVCEMPTWLLTANARHCGHHGAPYAVICGGVSHRGAGRATVWTLLWRRVVAGQGTVTGSRVCSPGHTRHVYRSVSRCGRVFVLLLLRLSCPSRRSSVVGRGALAFDEFRNFSARGSLFHHLLSQGLQLLPQRHSYRIVYLCGNGCCPGATDIRRSFWGAVIWAVVFVIWVSLFQTQWRNWGTFATDLLVIQPKQSTFWWG